MSRGGNNFFQTAFLLQPSMRGLRALQSFFPGRTAAQRLLALSGKAGPVISTPSPAAPPPAPPRNALSISYSGSFSLHPTVSPPGSCGSSDPILRTHLQLSSLHPTPSLCLELNPRFCEFTGPSQERELGLLFLLQMGKQRHRAIRCE